MHAKIFFVLIIGLMSHLSWSQAKVTTYYNDNPINESDIDCSAYRNQPEEQILKTIKKSDWWENRQCLIRDVVAEDALSYFKHISDLIPKLTGLPPKLIKKWQEITWAQVQIVSTNETLCLGSAQLECNEDSALVAKNYRWGTFKKKGLIIINRAQWNSLSQSERYSLIFHEVLGVIDIEKNSYQYSSMVNFSYECTTTYGINSGSMDCYIAVKTYDKTFILD